MSVLHPDADVEALPLLSRFRERFYKCLDRRADALFELSDAVMCADRPVTSLVELSLEPVFRRGHGALYDALSEGRVDEERLRDLLVDQLPADAPLMFGIDATTFPRPNAECSPDRGLHYAPCRCDGDRKVVPGWEFQWATALEWGSSSWTLPVDARRLPEGSCPVAATAAQIRDISDRLERRGQEADRPAPLFVLDQGYAAAALVHALDGAPIQTLVRIAGDRVFYDGRPGPRKPGPGRNGVHGQRFELAAPVNLRRADQLLIVPDTRQYGRVEVRAWHRMHQKVHRTGYFATLGAKLFSRLPILEGTVIEVRVERLPDGRAPHRTMWLWHHGPELPDLDICWRAYLRRFDMEHTFKLMKSQLGWTAARLRHPEQAARWTWLLLAAYAQLRLARGLVGDLRRPWERRPRPGKPLTPYRVRRAFRHLRDRLGTPSRVPKTSHPGPGRPPGGKNAPAPRHRLGSELRKSGAPATQKRKKKG
ncbi:transposase [Streptomyces sp. NBC_01754]|uniref:NF041680 family putative transposase n=1 Tax=Streptomyces sp. NBC_01754 TaxID=2975930 RepID=UPI002DD7F456|nr:NF041680 family putative transposase [Streptomyces sp. NBC_01754]WSC92397.1 transposase [Streptomyces sp. NBC_01754]